MKKRTDIVEAEIVTEDNAQALVPKVTFDSANKPKYTELEPGFEAIVESIHIEDVKGTYDRLEKALRIGEKRTERGVVLRRLDEAETNARSAHKLWMNAKVEFMRWELDNETVFASMMAEATRVLQKEKEDGLRSKQITDADVRSMVAYIFPNEYKHQEVKRVRVKGMVSDCEHLAEMWRQRVSTLRSIYEKVR